MAGFVSVVGWVKDAASAVLHWRTIDTQIADQAIELRRMIAASFQRWPMGLHTLDELTTWASALAAGFPKTKPALDKLVELRSKTWGDTSKHVRSARNEFNAAADIVNPFGLSGVSIQSHERERYTIQLRQAEAHVRRCLDALKKLGAKA
jgi:hypothetical protein